jgi:non-specific serine/threonine protein kinase
VSAKYHAFSANTYRRIVRLEPVDYSSIERLFKAYGLAPVPHADYSMPSFQEARTEHLARERVEPEEAEPVATQVGSGPHAAAAPAEALDNLPRQISTFIGRERELTEVTALLAASPLLTLTGAGGCGKSRLALQAAAGVRGRYPHGVWLVELAAMDSPALVAHAVAAVLGLREDASADPSRLLARHLRNRSLLLVLDNCEHLLQACAELAGAVLQGCPGVTILATSREPLNIAGERRWRVPSLSAPVEMPLEEKELSAILLSYDACRLFVERAREHRSDFHLTRRNAPVIANLCRRLDGIPLAIELAAARASALSVEEINDRLDRGLDFLMGGSRAALPRQQTLRALIDWSYDLLSAEERTLLRRLSVFAGGFTLHSAEPIVASGEIDRHRVLDLVTSLADKSLVTPEISEGETRYRLLETIRQYARDRLDEGGESESVRTRHQAFFLALAEEAAAHLSGPDQGAWLDRLEEEHDNLRAALDSGSAETALRMVAALWQFWDMRGYLGEGLKRVTRVLAAPQVQAPTAARARALRGAGALTRSLGDFAAARSWHERSLEICRELGDAGCTASALYNIANIAHHQGDDTAARTMFEESLAIHRERGETQAASWSLFGLGDIAYGQGDYTRARSLYEETVAIRRESGDSQGVAWALNNLANVALAQGEIATARNLFEECLAIQREVASRQGVAWALLGLGSVADKQGDYPRARSSYGESLSIVRELGNERGIAYSLLGQAEVAYDEGDFKAAQSLYRACEAIQRRVGNQRGIACALLGLAAVARSLGSLADARSKAEEALSIVTALGNSQGIATALDRLGDIACDEGRLAEAEKSYAAALARKRALGDKHGIARSVEAFAVLATEHEQKQRATQLLGAAAALRSAIGCPLSRVEQETVDRQVARLRAALTEKPSEPRGRKGERCQQRRQWSRRWAFGRRCCV